MTERYESKTQGRVLGLAVDEEVELRLLTEQYAEPLNALTVRNLAHLRPWFPWAAGEITVEDTRAFIRESIGDLALSNGMQLGIWYRGYLAGAIGLLYVRTRSRQTEIGYWLGREFEGKGIVTRACGALIAHAFIDLGLNKVEITCAETNLRSAAVAERLGFTLEGTRRDAEFLNGRFMDHRIYGLLAREWKPR